MTWKLEDVLEPAKLLDYWERPEYCEEPWKLEEMLPFKLQWKTISYNLCEKLPWVNNNKVKKKNSRIVVLPSRWTTDFKYQTVLFDW